jgi:predicted nucleic acid-binding protein
MRGPVFADSGFWIARLSPRDQLHAKAREISRSLHDRHFEQAGFTALLRDWSLNNG